VRRFNAAQSRDYVQAVYQGDYFEGLASCAPRLPLAARLTLSHVWRVVPYLAEARVLEPLSDSRGCGVESDPRSSAGGLVAGRRATSSWCAASSNRSTPIALT